MEGPCGAPFPPFPTVWCGRGFRTPTPGSPASPGDPPRLCSPRVDSPHPHPSFLPIIAGLSVGLPSLSPRFIQWAFPTSFSRRREEGGLSGAAETPRPPFRFLSRTVDSLYEELVLQGIIKKPPKVQLADYSGQWPYPLPLRSPSHAPVAANLGGKQPTQPSL